MASSGLIPRLASSITCLSHGDRFWVIAVIIPKYLSQWLNREVPWVFALTGPLLNWRGCYIHHLRPPFTCSNSSIVNSWAFFWLFFSFCFIILMPFRDLGFNFTYYYFINSLVLHLPELVLSDWRCKGTVIFFRFQEFSRILLSLVATTVPTCDISGKCPQKLSHTRDIPHT